MNIIGFPRIGEKRELKKALESYWAAAKDGGDTSEKEHKLQELLKVAKDLRKLHWSYQKNLENVVVNDFSFYDNMLDLSYALGVIPARFNDLKGLDLYFAMARGSKSGVACEMTKWFNTNYHYVVPELRKDLQYHINAQKIVDEYKEALSLGYNPKISLIGIFTYLGLSKTSDNSKKSDVFPNLKNAYFKLLESLVSTLGKDILIEFHEPIFVKGRDEFFSHIKEVYDSIAKLGIKSIVTTYFESSNEATEILVNSDIVGLGLDFVHGVDNLNENSLKAIANSGKKLYAGLIDGRNIWVANLDSKLNILDKISIIVPKDLIHISSSCSLLHVPFSKDSESKMNKEILSWLSFAREKIGELELLESIFRNGVIDSNKDAYNANKSVNDNRKKSEKIHDNAVQSRIANLKITTRKEPFKERIKVQRKALGYPDLATTTIGSFPQTPELRALRQKFKKGEIDSKAYESGIESYIKDCVAFQEEIGLDVLVHGEPERNDMVEYFGEQLKGFVFSQNGWVQSYGSRCVKPPIIFGDTSRPKAMTVRWITFAQSLTKKIMKGMLTGPVTILNWSFVRDDLARKDVCKQLSLCIADEISDLQDAGIKIIQVDEAAFKEGYPLRESKVKEYESWALECFKISSSVAKIETQIHTHMCYSEFNDIIKTIEAMDADVISIETARSGNELLKIFKKVGYANEVGPGVYDIHSPRIPSVDEIYKQIKLLLEVLPKSQLWINPDCGLKTRKWEEVKPSLKNMVDAVLKVRIEG
ncbi:5-methyltetrahydropteroyltriglutamate--homocysteine S-methyltransferase [Helicobacter saguini]|uniref:5-methyltetrahydropteroyltriglutamate--homocysteine S-methyltransferase n=1 Tax=Helicobacter saguini TaxID=1548018 RepID=A0A347VPW1_9HELI|nr:5-methyltetrahydropteroyltriglutamate--homocysteine S-methyltransferase [Helicobacter saguini]MWV61188.1 5-methyltetrahydropteroyltriglutamate--homocysteine S-methyltransferase [Helicobacter saguini]MWV68145.1 5-methyltetrahydropteroyltriglutamate--homocysteine S-methyltransferase [Helicobacter saguini]MWV70392.1 5-methyltetrahydropteroyltriglutamate--homocysteine S-methyltransferase [Helicobacter saguini]MWV72293.1 5-methyltetrahydropteroyltriglutamate--homocysteine S-methyltransferase [Hel